MPKVQIDEKLFVALVSYHLLNRVDDKTATYIRTGLQEKLDAIIRRQCYTDYKTAPTPAEREHARQEYLDARGVPDAYRWPTDDNP